MDKACHDCPAGAREPNPDARAKEEHYDRLRKDGTTWERVKADPDRLAARRLYQVLHNYRRDFPEDLNPPTIAAEVRARRIKNGIERRRRESEEQAAKGFSLTDNEVTALLAEFGF